LAFCRRCLSSIQHSRYFQVEKGATNKGYDRGNSLSGNSLEGFNRGCLEFFDYDKAKKGR
jgi:hypothetical protein